ncbi:HlyD family secretion protein [Photobacterium japonica]|uniref:efflux RND transporter periplasmic adaptor subunit n=1 Tax=Photobacterium japonica TaxID=2910235 RepID=UPI003D10D080
MLTPRKRLFVPAVLLGILILVGAILLRPTPASKPALERARAVDVITLQPQPLAPQAAGFGRVAPKVEWQAIAEVTGKVVYRHPDLEKGRVMDAGTVLLKIDPLDYELRLAQAQADVSASRAQLAQWTQEEKNLRTTLKIEKHRLALSQKELARKQELKRKGLASQSAVDLEQQTMLANQQTLQNIENQLIVLPNEKNVSQAQLDVNQSRVDEAKRALAKTVITLPIDARISSVHIEQDQVVNSQQTMVLAHGIDAVEIDAQIALHDMQVLASSLTQYTAHSDGYPRADQLDITASIALSSGDFMQRWPARVTRISDTVNANQATVGVILEVQQNYRQLSPESAPPLVNGMFVQAHLTGQTNTHWVIPERALHGNTVYLISPEQELVIVPVAVLFRRAGQVAISGDLRDGQAVVLNDLLPAVAGMALHAVTRNGRPVLPAAKAPAEEKQESLP